MSWPIRQTLNLKKKQYTDEDLQKKRQRNFKKMESSQSKKNSKERRLQNEKKLYYSCNLSRVRKIEL